MTAVAETEETTANRAPDRDFTTVNELHVEIANYVNARSNLPPVTPHQVKAVLALRTDHMRSPERVAARQAAQAARDQAQQERAAQEAKYAGLTDEQKAAVKKAERAAAAAEKARAAAQALLG